MNEGDHRVEVQLKRIRARLRELEGEVIEVWREQNVQTDCFLELIQNQRRYIEHQNQQIQDYAEAVADQEQNQRAQALADSFNPHRENDLNTEGETPASSESKDKCATGKSVWSELQDILTGKGMQGSFKTYGQVFPCGCGCATRERQLPNE